MPLQRAKWLLAGGLLLACGFSPAFADEPAADAAIAKLLEVGWKAGQQARADADRQYQEAATLAAGDPRALAASWLVLMQQRRYDEALTRIDAYLAKQPGDLQALRAKAWVQAILKNYEGTLLTADKLSAQMAAEPPISQADAAQHAELLAFLGRMFGFLGGPVADVANQDQRKAVEKQVLARLDSTQQPEFEEARDSVLQKHLELTDSKFEERQRVVDQAEADKEKSLADVAAERDQIATRGDELLERRQRLQAELKGELDELAKDDAPLQQELIRLDAREVTLDRDLDSYLFEINRLEQLGRAEKDPFRRQQFFLEADRLAAFASRIESDLIGIRRLMNNVQAQRAALFARAQAAQANTAGQVQRIDREGTDLAKREKRAVGIEKRVSRPAAATSSKSRSLAAQAAALTTYDQFPLEAAREKLLESLR